MDSCMYVLPCVPPTGDIRGPCSGELSLHTEGAEASHSGWVMCQFGCLPLGARHRPWQELGAQSQPPSPGLLPLPNKVRIYNFVRGNIWLISLKSFFFFKKIFHLKSFHFSSVSCLLSSPSPPPRVFLTSGDSEQRAEDITHS